MPSSLHQRAGTVITVTAVVDGSAGWRCSSALAACLLTGRRENAVLKFLSLHPSALAFLVGQYQILQGLIL